MSRTRTQTLEEHRANLLRVFHIGPDDVLANRRGELGPGQRRRIMWWGYVNLILMAVLALGLIAIVYAVGERPFEAVQIVLVTLFVAILLAIGVGYLIRSYQAAMAGEVRCVAGPVRVVLVSRAGWFLYAGDERFKLPIHGWHVSHDIPYRVYVTPTGKRIVAMEPDWG
ncbi:MAG TPA: hypothetical protein VF743_13585 [Acidimicrobiales bacterium]